MGNNDSMKELRDAGLQGIRAICVSNPALAALADNIMAVASGAKVARDSKELERPVKRDELAALLGISGKAIDYHARRGRLVKVQIPGARRALGFTRESVRACFGL